MKTNPDRALAPLFLSAAAAATMLISMGGDARAWPKSACYINDGYVVSSTVKDDGDYDIVVKRKGAADAPLPCPLAAGDAELSVESGHAYVDLLDNHLVLGSAFSSGEVLVIDLRTGKPVVDVEGNYDSNNGIELYYSKRRPDSAAAVTRENCPDLDALKANGLDVGLRDVMILNLETNVSTPTGDVECEGIS